MDGHYYQPPETSQEPQMHLTDKSCQNVRVLDQTWSSYQSGNKWIVHHPHKILHFSDTFDINRDEHGETHIPYGDWNQIRNTNHAFFPVPYVLATHRPREQLASQNYQYFKAVPFYPWMLSVICMNGRCVCPLPGEQNPLSVPLK